MDKRKLKIALSLGILIPSVLFIAGIIAQFIININAWKAAGSDYRVSPGLPSLAVPEILEALLHFPEGVIAIAAVVVGIILICIFGLWNCINCAGEKKFSSVISSTIAAQAG